MAAIRSVLILSLLVLLVAPRADAGEAQFDYTLLASPADTAVPGVPDVFAFFGTPAVSGSEVAFFGAAGAFVSNSPFAYTHQGHYIRHVSGTGPLTVIADWLTPIPDGTGTFTRLQYVSLEGGGAAFRGEGEAGQQGIYKYRNGVLSTVADLATEVPGQPAGTAFSALSARPWFCESNMTTFKGSFVDGAGVYVEIDEALRPVADTGTEIPPGGMGDFFRFGPSDFSTAPAVDAGRVVFVGESEASGKGIYLWDDGVLKRVADTTTPVPGGFGTFADFISVNIDGPLLVFRGEWSSEAGEERVGIYAYEDDVLSLLVDYSTVVSNTGMPLDLIGSQGVALDGGEVAFLCKSGPRVNQGAICATVDGTLTEIARDGFVAFHATAGVYGQSRDGNVVAFQGGLTSLSLGLSASIWVATITLCGDGLVNPASEECDDGNTAIGDGCSHCRRDICGDANDSGGADAADITRLRGHLAAPLSSPLSSKGREKCPVIAPEACDIGAATVLRRALLPASLPPGIAPVCPFITSLASVGGPCGSDTECESRFCAEGVCCESACLGLCDSCRKTNTGQPEGICGPSSSAIEVCDGLDNDCDLVLDEPNTPDCSLFFHDSDGDGFGALDAESSCLCSPSGFFRADNRDDCYDGPGGQRVNPAQTSFSTFISGNGYDYNCDAVEELEISTLASCIGRCIFRPGWQGPVPACGEPGLLLTGCDRVGLTCVATTESAVQACR